MSSFKFKYEKHYTRLHEKKPKWFSGKMNLEDADQIAELVKLTEAKTLLDYGSGKGYQYLKSRVHERWGGILPYCYDIGVVQLKERPQMKFDGVICTDVLEHIHPDDIHTILKDLVSFLDVRENKLCFMFLGICCRPASKSFEDGTNVHLSVLHPDVWRSMIDGYRSDRIIIRENYEYIPYDHDESEGVAELREEDG